ncbi:MAG: NAD(P)H-dependent oxidoreductase subunit E [Actinomycetia bacterium]|nr:NAD(P)H-dependent oxidoreductase subunit E [Actinomycetes bacterium]
MTTNATAGETEEQELEEQFVELLEHYRGERGALVPLLQGAQAIFGYLPEDVMRRVAEATGEPLSKALGVATFYAQFRLRPHAKHTIRCCHGTACHVSGATRISEELEKYLGIKIGENTPDMLYTIEEVHCVGACGMAPVVMINDRAHGKLTPEKAVEVVRAFQAEAEGSGAEVTAAAEPAGNAVEVEA